jgi:hypothetical protein
MIGANFGLGQAHITTGMRFMSPRVCRLSSLLVRMLHQVHNLFILCFITDTTSAAEHINSEHDNELIEEDDHDRSVTREFVAAL